MIYYISGSISNNRNYQEEFAAAEKYLKSQGHEIINPATISAVLPSLPYTAYMQLSLVLLSCASAIYLLSGWKHSPGAVVEKLAAESLGLTVIYQTEEVCNTSAAKADLQTTLRR